ncbi:hypothetical protein D7Z26_08150 [Cohnella endophytica]|uniref:Uncharacterized protein n=1 Tax=Cohnella endophytica TaxID=2419778 RepID=A0A494Y3V8_9BACL|nr:hypothetical protein [Cohnella endophytica]RKP55181.1 hypothetical protein D7Z26_08150 [Cohnella endophytica]
MTAQKPEWYREAQGGLGKGTFTEEMKREVVRVIENKPADIRTKRSAWRLGGAVLAAIVVGMAILLPMLTNTGDQSSLASPPSSIFGTNDPGPAGSDNPSSTGQATNDERIPLVYEDPAKSLGDYPVEVDRIEGVRIAKSSVIVKRVIKVDGLGNYYVYAKQEGDSQLYAGMGIVAGGQETSDLYEIGTAGELTYLNDVEITKSNLFGSFHLRLYASCGANCVTNNWFHFEDSMPGVPISDFRLNAFVQEADLDGDGNTEAVAAVSSTIGKAIVYKLIDGKVRFVDMNLALHAEHPSTVVYDGERQIFRVIRDTGEQQYSYVKGTDSVEIVKQPITASKWITNSDAYDGTPAISLPVGDGETEAHWFQAPREDFGLYLPDAIKKVQFEDGYQFQAADGLSYIDLRNPDETPLPVLRKEKDLETYSDYLGSEFWGDNKTIRFDYFAYEPDKEHGTIIVIRSPSKDAELHSLLLAVATTVRYSPNG